LRATSVELRKADRTKRAIRWDGGLIAFARGAEDLRFAIEDRSI
jgi:hypothetical protein